MKNTALVCCCLSGLLTLPADAARVAGLYQAETMVGSQSDGDWRAAVRACLGMALVKLTGARDVSRDAVLQPILDEAEQFVQQYRYHEAQAEIPARPGAAGVPGWHLTVTFDEDKLNASLRGVGAPLWDKERPSILVWLVLEREQRRAFIRAGDDSVARTLLQRLAQRRGVPILFPLLDLGEQLRIRPGDVWLDFREPLLAASVRYNADLILTASVGSPLPGIWEGRWRSYRDGALEHEWHTETDLPELALEEGFNAFVDTLVGEFVRSAGYTRSADLEITVRAVDSLERYARLLDYLGSLNSVSHIHVKEARRGELVLVLTAHGGEQVILQTLSLGRMLEPVADTDGHHYRLARAR